MLSLQQPDRLRVVAEVDLGNRRLSFLSSADSPLSDAVPIPYLFYREHAQADWYLTPYFAVPSVDDRQGGTLNNLAYSPDLIEAVRMHVVQSVAFAEFSAETSSISRASGRAKIPVVLSWPVASSAGLSWTAVDDSDQVLDRGTLVFEPGSLDTRIEFNLDSLSSTVGDQRVQITLEAPTGGISLGGRIQHELAVRTAPVAVSFRVLGSQVSESEGRAEIELVLTHPLAEATTVAYTVASGTAMLDEDFTVAGETQVTFDSGATRAVVEVVVFDDGVEEVEAETVLLTLVPSPPLVFGGFPDHVLNITDTPTHPVVQFQTFASILEESEGPVSLLLQWSPALTEDGSVDVELFGGTASHEGDYTLSAATVLLPSGATETRLTVELVDDLIPEPMESVVVELANPSPGFALGTNTKTHGVY